MSSPVRRPGLPRASKARGDVGEARFMAKILSLGFSVAKPFGENAPFDFIVAVEGKLWKVQVKSAWTPEGSHTYCFCTGRGSRSKPYTARDADFIVAYVGPADAWFVIPVEQLAGRQSMKITTPDDPKYDRYREAWHLLCPAAGPERTSCRNNTG